MNGRSLTSADVAIYVNFSDISDFIDAASGSSGVDLAHWSQQPLIVDNM
ncbi:MAG: hypothetical protein ABGZ23_14995 [Fuerstiella sp.]